MPVSAAIFASSQAMMPLSMEAQGSIVIAVTVDGNSRRLQEQALRMRALDTRDCKSCHDDSSLAAAYRARPMTSKAIMDELSHGLSWRPQVHTSRVIAFACAAIAISASAQSSQTAQTAHPINSVLEIKANLRACWISPDMREPRE